MKIAFLTPEYPHPKTGKSGGIGTSIKNLSQGLIASGKKVRVLVYGQNQDAIFEDNGIVIQQIKNVKIKGLSWWFTRKKIEKIINQLHQNNEIDLVEAPDWTGITAFIKPKKCPIVIKLHGSDTYFCNLDKRPVKWFNTFLEKKALQSANAYLSVSQFTAQKTNEVFGLSINFEIIHNGVAIDKFRFSKTQSKPVVLYFGTLIRKKGCLEIPFIFNEVIRQIPEAQLFLVGKDNFDILTNSASTWQLMKEMFTEKALKNTTYIAEVPYQEIQEYIQNAQVCIFPSFAEALPVSWIEAMAMGKVLVASNIGWATEVIDDNLNGFAVDPKNHAVYAQKIVEVYNNSSLQEKLSQQARKKVINTFSLEVIIERSIGFYERVISSR